MTTGQRLLPIPAKRYFTIGETGVLCDVKPHVLRYWEQEFTQLRPQKRAGNRRYYQHHEVLMIRKIRSLLYDKGFTIVGARNQLQALGSPDQWTRVLAQEEGLSAADVPGLAPTLVPQDDIVAAPDAPPAWEASLQALTDAQRTDIRQELAEIARLLRLD